MIDVINNNFYHNGKRISFKKACEIENKIVQVNVIQSNSVYHLSRNIQIYTTKNTFTVNTIETKIISYSKTRKEILIKDSGGTWQILTIVSTDAAKDIVKKLKQDFFKVEKFDFYF